MLGLTHKEFEESKRLSKKHGVPVYVFKDGDWIAHHRWNHEGCPPRARNTGFGKTPDEAVADLLREADHA
jgi:hypothetical protein